ncbi:aminoglycoside phosphotransferase family protein [Piscinibacter aquaticus]|uniref:Aminoglycoside phosphotransferase family protein n=1 Tax=Piscinibacter aquaticus TaxID=392597 RepID=A0A5C6U414_9BURK|nr:aminoglycoside phosphotransferase family protein [Piscinibacter aquaticus]
MTPPADLRSALRSARSPWAEATLEPLPDQGPAHAHVRLVGSGLLARIPKQSQMKLAAADNLAYQAACFERAAASGHAPRLHGLLPPSAALPRGALLVEEIVGRAARLPHDLPAIAEALAAIHSLALPDAAARAPLLDPADPLALLRDEIEAQAAYFDAAGLAPQARAAIEAQRRELDRLCARTERPPKRLIAFDAHPGNFIVRADGRAVLVDLEKARYSLPPLDLAHATLYTSTTWDVASHAVLSVDEVRAFQQHWLSRCAGAEAWRGWLVPLRAAMWLWSVSWCAKWRVTSSQPAQRSADGEDWSAQRSEAGLVAHVRSRVDDYLGAPGVGRVIEELAALAA